MKLNIGTLAALASLMLLCVMLTAQTAPPVAATPAGFVASSDVMAISGPTGFSAGNLTTEVNSAILGVSLYNTGINQRATTRWIAAQESQFLISPATAQNGLELRVQSSTFTSTCDGQVSFVE